MQAIHVDVSAEDLAHGERGNCLLCPVARALARLLPGARVSVHSLAVEINGRRYTTPQAVRDFVAAFDDPGAPWRAKPAPFEFTIWIEDSVEVGTTLDPVVELLPWTH